MLKGQSGEWDHKLLPVDHKIPASGIKTSAGVPCYTHIKIGAHGVGTITIDAQHISCFGVLHERYLQAKLRKPSRLAVHGVQISDNGRRRRGCSFT